MLLAATAAVFGCAAQASATSLTPGDVVVERDGNGGTEALTNASTPVYLNEFEPTGGLVTALALPTSVSGSNKNGSAWIKTDSARNFAGQNTWPRWANCWRELLMRSATPWLASVRPSSSGSACPTQRGRPVRWKR